MVGCDLDGRPWLPPTQLLSNTTIMRPCSRSIFRERWVRVATRGGGEAWERALRLSRLVWIEGIASQRRQAQGPRIRSTQPLAARPSYPLKHTCKAESIPISCRPLSSEGSLTRAATKPSGRTRSIPCSGKPVACCQLSSLATSSPKGPIL